MAYIRQFCIILAFSFVGEILHFFIPLPIPASIYGIILLFAALQSGLVKLNQVEKTGQLLIDIMPVMFIPAAVGLVEVWSDMKGSLVQFVAVMVVSTVAVMGVSGRITQFFIRKRRKDT
ncbi:MAG TPA: CidA/LrgA family protein [Ruminococcus sp.]|nr:CidA/LrgA family protein [Ruminococcus sp.]